jgi:hypothetical protein
LFAGAAQDGVEEAQKLLLVAFFSHHFEKEKVIEGVGPSALYCRECFHTYILRDPAWHFDFWKDY